ncbi:A/G-specific adenine glycosylase [Streptococcus infantarius subsp. infantarius]|nr:A/G-specific adenine glycosylase [Streptococcus infantarius subsp. infantarius]MCO4474296.1 A/G-specific adenine glycosylase [Streptococcus infantarius subsp. infantarius]
MNIFPIIDILFQKVIAQYPMATPQKKMLAEYLKKID